MKHLAITITLLIGLNTLTASQEPVATSSGVLAIKGYELPKCPTHGLNSGGHSTVRICPGGDLNCYEGCTVDYYQAQVEALRAAGMSWNKVKRGE